MPIVAGMADNWEGPVDPDAGPTGAAPDQGDQGMPPAGGRPAHRAAALWKLLGDDLAQATSSAPGTDGPSGRAIPGAAPADPPSSGSPAGSTGGWEESELGELLARAWFEATDPAPADVVATDAGWDQPAAWEVEALPTAERGGILGLFTGAATLAPAQAEGAASGPVPLAPLRAPVAVPGDAPVPPVSGRARLAEMIEQLPTEPTPRVRPDDIDIEPPIVAPVAIWFWGDDDIYAGRGPSGGPASQARAGRGRRPKPSLAPAAGAGTGPATGAARRFGRKRKSPAA